ncbi:MAG: alpha-galactosidase, partial [Allomuricauda sp.]
DSKGVAVTGWGLEANDLTNQWRSIWANWSLVYTGKDIDRDKQLKRFDRMRYPINKELDIYMLANTWGSNNRMAASTESNILKEIEVQAELGIDVQQIDDGWQNPEGITAMSTVSWKPDSTRYPNGWKNVSVLAKKKNIKLGLWFSLGSLNEQFLKKYGHNWAADLEDLKEAYDRGGFTYYKLDMIDLHNYDELERLMDLSRIFVDYTDRSVRINWDVTENEPRIGYFFGREYGNIYLANRTVRINNQTGYIPYLMLRDAWHVSKYLNLNKFQISIQNIERTDKNNSNAHLHNHAYVTAIALMGSPLFFQETHYYSQDARKEIKNLLSIYKKHRNNMYKGIVYPIGNEPDDRSWTGFQNHWEEKGTGFLMIFRELNNLQKKKGLSLNFCAGQSLELKNLITGKKRKVTCDSTGKIVFKIEDPADFLFLSYKIL